ncbi:MAG TPA: Xaa-Pro peptidase family protein [Chloroflexota bacterium]|nr:Xaa-Pro peptidase family protein [Chloroflexota bacterium]
MRLSRGARHDFTDGGHRPMDAILLTGDSDYNQNLYYKTHFLAEGLIYLEVNGEGTLITSEMERGRAEKESSVHTVRTLREFGFEEAMQELNDRTRAFTTALSRAIRDSGADRLIVGPDFPALLADNFRLEGIDVQIDPKLLDAARRQKSEQEIAAIEESQRATERAAGRAVEVLRDSEVHGDTLHYNGIPLTMERLRSEIEVSLVRDGMDPVSPITAAGRGAADPHWIGHGPIRPGDSLVLDIFPRSKTTRYFSDMTRTVVKGRPSQVLARMYEATLQAQEAAFAQIRAGANGKDVHQAAVDAFREAGFDGDTGPRYIHSTGHGVGLDIHEAPGLGTLDVELQENEVVTVEPGLYDPEIGAVRIEDIVVVTKDGYRNLTRFPKQFEI